MARRRGGINQRMDTSRYLEELANMERRASLPSAEARGIQSKMSHIDKLREELYDRAGTVGTSRADLEEFGFKGDRLSELMSGSSVDRGLAISRKIGHVSEGLDKRMESLRSNYDEVQSRRQSDTERRFQSRIMGMARPERLESETARMSREGGALGSSMGLAGMATDTELNKGLSRNRRTQSRLADELVEASKGIGQPGGREAFLDIASKLETAKAGGAGMMGALERQRKAGTDLFGIEGRVSGTVGEIQDRRYGEGLAQKVSSGKTGSIKEEMGGLRKAEDAFVEAANKFRQSLEETGDASKELREEVEKSAKAHKEQKDVVDEMNKQGRGKGGFTGGGWQGDAKAILGVASAGIATARYAGVTSEMEQMGVRTGMASFTSQKYNDMFAATQGDYGAILRYRADIYNRGASSAVVLGDRERIMKGTETVAYGVDAGIQGAALAKGMIAGDTSAAIVNTAKSGATAIDAGVNTYKNISGGQVQITRAGQEVELFNASQAVRAAAGQRWLNFNMSSYGATAGMGSGAGRGFNAATNNANVSALAGLGIDPERQAALFSAGAAQMGAQFVGGNAAGIVSQAARAERARVMSADQYMGMAGQLTNVGGSDKNLETIMMNAVSRGVDNAKNISGLVAGITGLAAASASRGIDTTLGAQNTMLRSIGAMAGTGMTEEMKQAAASSAIDRANQITGGTSLTLGKMMRQATVGRIGGLDPTTQAALSTLDLTTQNTLNEYARTGQIDKLRELAMTKGVEDAYFDKSGKFTNKNVAALQSGVGQELGIGAVAFGAKPGEVEDFTTGKKKFEDLSSQARYYLDKVGLGRGSAGIATGGEVNQAALKIDKTGELGGAADIAQAQAEAQAKQIREAGALEPEGLRGVAKTVKKAGLEYGVEKGAKEATEAAMNVTLDSTKFNTAVGDFQRAVNILLEEVRQKPVSEKVGITKPNRQGSVRTNTGKAP